MVICYILWTVTIGRGGRNKHGDDDNDVKGQSKAMIIASMKKDDTSWYAQYFPDWERNIYVVDDPEANLTVALNKGREGNVYLT